MPVSFGEPLIKKGASMRSKGEGGCGKTNARTKPGSEIFAKQTLHSGRQGGAVLGDDWGKKGVNAFVVFGRQKCSRGEDSQHLEPEIKTIREQKRTR